MASAHPRTQIVVVSLVCIVIVAIAVLWSRGNIVKDPDTTAGLDKNLVATTNIADQVSTNNTDWKKYFLTGNITTDGASSTKAASVDNNNDQNMTAYLGKATLASYMVLQNSGLDSDQTSIDNATKNIISSTLNYKTPVTYVMSDINTTPKSDDITLTTFKSAVATSLSLYNVTKNEALITRQYLEEKNPLVLKQIDPIIKNYQDIINSLKKIKTPSVVSKNMLGLINGFSAMKFVAESLRAAKTDPLAAMVGANNYLDGIKQIIDSLQKIRTYIESRGGTFTFDGSFVDIMLNNE